jgi:hypothetical protein
MIEIYAESSRDGLPIYAVAGLRLESQRAIASPSSRLRNCNDDG